MRAYLYSILLALFLGQAAWAESTGEEAGVEDEGFKIEVSMDDESEDSKPMTEEELERKIKGKVFSIIGDIVDAAEDDLTDEEKAEIKQDIKEAIVEIEEAAEELEDEHSVVINADGGGIFDDGLTLLEALIPLTAIVFTFGMPIMIVAVVLYSSYRKKRLMHDTINQYVSSGKDIPPEVLKGLNKESAPKNNLHSGLVMGGVGLGMLTCFAVMGKSTAAALGLIPLFIGLAQLLIWKLEKKGPRE